MRSFSSDPKVELKPRSHSLNPRLQELRLPVGILENFLAATKEISVQELEYVPYQRLVLAHTLNEECSGSLKQILMETLHLRNNDFTKLTKASVIAGACAALPLAL